MSIGKKNRDLHASTEKKTKTVIYTCQLQSLLQYFLQRVILKIT